MTPQPTPDAPQRPQTPALADWLQLQRILYERALREGDEARAAFYKRIGMIQEQGIEEDDRTIKLYREGDD